MKILAELGGHNLQNVEGVLNEGLRECDHMVDTLYLCSGEFVLFD